MPEFRKLGLSALIFFSFLFISVTATAEPGPGDVEFIELSVESELQKTVGGRPLYAINYTVRNVGIETLTYLKIAIVGLNDQKQIVEVADSQIFYSGSLPQGLVPSGEIVRRHGLEVTNPNEIVASIELSVIEVR